MRSYIEALVNICDLFSASDFSCDVILESWDRSEKGETFIAVLDDFIAVYPKKEHAKQCLLFYSIVVYGNFADIDNSANV